MNTTDRFPSAKQAANSLPVDFSWLFVGNSVYAASQWVTLMLLAKLTRPELVGQYALGLAIALPVFMFTNLQLRAVVTTDVHEKVQFGTYLCFRLLSTTLAFAIIFASTLILGYRWELKVVILVVAVAQAIESISDIYHARLQLHAQMDRISKSLIARSILSAIALALTVYFTGSLLWGLLGIVLARTILLLGYDIRSRTHGLASRSDLANRSEKFREEQGLQPRWDARVQRELLWLSLPLGIIAILVALTTNIPRYFLEHVVGERALGIFSALAFMFSAGNMAITSLGQSAFTRLANSYSAEDGAKFRSILGNLLAVAGILGIAGVAIAMIAGPEILAILFRPEYAEHTNLLITIMVAAAIQYLAGVLGSAATAARFFKPQIPLLVAVVTTCGLASYWLIPAYGVLGGGYAMVATSIALLAGEIILMWWILKELPAHSNVAGTTRSSRLPFQVEGMSCD